MHVALQRSDLCRNYLASRGIAAEQAQQYGVCYLPAMENVASDDPLRGWYGRLIFPLTSPDGEVTFAGRTLEWWQLGMSPAEHKAAIDEP